MGRRIDQLAENAAPQGTDKIIGHRAGTAFQMSLTNLFSITPAGSGTTAANPADAFYMRDVDTPARVFRVAIRSDVDPARPNLTWELVI